GHRLGQGGGHYDRTLAALRAHAPLIAVGAAFSGQEIDAVPAQPHDQPLDWIVTDRAVLGPFRPQA
ncbi:MAG TPA: 5-formyltetrahydrofolate cyclo-ligase, partial [Thermopetrobacter sp.]|nr:5-formyltetrahydrofolate cyclo-ligase [Thermopetrobacter sp.]